MLSRISGMRTLCRWTGSVLLGAVLLFSDALPAQAQQSFNGRYAGIDEARGLTLDLRETGGTVAGRISASDGSGQDLQGRIENGAIVGKLTYQGQRGTVTFRPKPLGVAMIWRPEAGVAANELIFAFRRQDLAMPTPPPGYRPPPPLGSDEGDALVFLSSYEFWPPGDAARIYDLLDPSERTITRIFPALHTDVIWKLCQSNSSSREIGVALRGSGVTCATVDAAIKRAQATGSFNAYKYRVRTESYDAQRAIECARGIHTAAICEATAQKTQRAAASMETVSTVLRGL